MSDVTEATEIVGKRIFLSGPMTGYDDYNERGFIKAQILLKRLGVESVYSPIIQWICEPERISEKRSHESYMLECLHELTRYDDNGNPHYDAVVQLDAWQDSEGARMEAEAAKACGIPLIPLSQLDEKGDEKDDGKPAPSCEPKPGPLGVWDSWQDIGIRWRTVEADGSETTRIVSDLSDLHWSDLIVLLAIQTALSHGGHDEGTVKQTKIFNFATCGMNAFSNTIQCDLLFRDGSSGRMQFELSGPAVPDKSVPLIKQVEVLHFSSNGILGEKAGEPSWFATE